MNKHSCIFLILSLLFFCQPQANENLENRIKSLAFQIIGFDSLSQLIVHSSKFDKTNLKYKDLRIPFSSSGDSNKAVLNLSINEIPSFSNTFTLELRNKYTRDLQISIDSTLGIPIKIVSKLKGLPEILYIESYVGELEDELTRIGDEFFGLPSTPPSISFLDAFHSSRHQNVRAKEIVAFYIIWGNNQYSPRPAWIIQLRGDVEEDSTDVYPKLLKNTNYSTNIIDANTGKLVGGIEIRRNTAGEK